MKSRDGVREMGKKEKKRERRKVPKKKSGMVKVHDKIATEWRK